MFRRCASIFLLYIITFLLRVSLSNLIFSFCFRYIIMYFSNIKKRKKSHILYRSDSILYIIIKNKNKNLNDLYSWFSSIKLRLTCSTFIINKNLQYLKHIYETIFMIRFNNNC